MCENPERLWHPANNGTGTRRWFLVRPDSVPLAQRYYEGSDGRLVRYASYASASRAAKKLNDAIQQSGWQCVGAGNDS